MYNIFEHIDNMQYMLNIKYLSDMKYMQPYCIYVHVIIHHICIKVLWAFLNFRQISITFSVLVLLLAKFRTCKPALPKTE